jgi:peptidoglycan hydrolase CwlO-like protein
MKLNAIYINRLNKEVKETERKLSLQQDKLNDAVECSKIDVSESGSIYESTKEHIEEIKNRIEELKNHIVYLNNILVKGEL